MNISSYPWLIWHYRKIIEFHQTGRAHDVLLFQSIKGTSDDILVWKISCWLMCYNKKDLQICGSCHSCKLMNSNNHPDWYSLSLENNKTSISIDEIRELIEKLYCFAQQEGAKVVWISNANDLTEEATNALLKIIEEPPKNCWFFLRTYEYSNLLPTLRSRCMTWNILPPDESYSLQWLQRKCLNSHEILRTALKLNNDSPEAALLFLNSGRWEKRKKFYLILSNALCYGDFLKLLPALNNENISENLNWLISLLVDVMKMHISGDLLLNNSDQKDLIMHIYRKLTFSVLDSALQQWIDCFVQIKTIKSINYELILTNQLLYWENLFFPKL